MKNAFIHFILVLIIFPSCKRERINKHCCEDKPLVKIFQNGYLAIPNAFSPDNDGLNDELIIWNKDLKTFKISIKNQLGFEVFKTDNPNNYWDGKINGKFKEGFYRFKLQTETNQGENFEATGSVCLVNISNGKYCLKYLKDCFFPDQWNGGGFDEYRQDTPLPDCD